MLDRYNRRLRSRKDREHRSNLETQVEEALLAQGYAPQYEPEKFGYVLHRQYRPDFKVGDVYVEVKGWWPPAERTKFLAVIMNNPGLPIFVALQRPHMTLSKQSKTTYAQWCSKYGIAWCPIPIPPEFMQQWMAGARPTFHAPARNAKAQTEQPSTQTVLFTASSANSATQNTENLGHNE
jgi:hypothetical protein